mmetsp:Transcript_20435/g.2733  ORF Transcript_20435/g.2733 Transcript_20435/m.2733 type:complete len:150 (+) Transcript_20435:157-606(+)
MKMSLNSLITKELSNKLKEEKEVVEVTEVVEEEDKEVEEEVEEEEDTKEIAVTLTTIIIKNSIIITLILNLSKDKETLTIVKIIIITTKIPIITKNTLKEDLLIPLDLHLKNPVETKLEEVTTGEVGIIIIISEKIISYLATLYLIKIF